MVKLTSRTSRLKSDDFNLKGRPFSEKMCPNCDHGNIEDVKHILCQCPYNQREISEMYDDLYALQDGSGQYVINSIWEIVGSTVARIYRKIILAREGIG